jgi:hypothetical protein
MTLQRFFRSVVVVSAAMLMTPIVAAHAATKFCDVMPERCRWGSDGLLYYYLPGQRLPSGIPGPGGRDQTTARNSGSWGCGATDGVASRGRSWAHPDRAGAAQDAVKACAIPHGANCHIVSCRSSIGTREAAETAWPKFH